VFAYRIAASMVTGTVVDAGCGEGYGTAILSGRAGRVVGVDIDGPTLSHASYAYPASGFVRGDLGRLPLVEGSVDAIVSLQAIEHLDDPDAFLEGCKRALKPDGLLIVSTPNRATFPAGINPFHSHEYDAAELAELLKTRFARVAMTGVGHGWRLRWLERTMGEPIQQLLVSAPYVKLPPLVRGFLRTVGPRSFAPVRDPSAGLDLFAVCRTIEP
jgi:SAM-dependent methyltransferase